MKKVKEVCDVCGSENIVFDATALWDTDEQKFVLAYISDGCWCNECDDKVVNETVVLS